MLVPLLNKHIIYAVKTSFIRRILFGQNCYFLDICFNSCKKINKNISKEIFFSSEDKSQVDAFFIGRVKILEHFELFNTLECLAKYRITDAFSLL